VVRAALQELIQRAPQPPPLLVTQSSGRADLPEVPDAQVISFPGLRFDTKAVVDLVPRLRKLRLGGVVVPVRESTLAEAYVSYTAAFLLAFLSGAGEVQVRLTSGDWQRASLTAFLWTISADLLALPLVPLRTVGLLWQMLTLRPQRPVINLTAVPSDMPCHIVKARWSRRVGLLGCSLQAYMGNPFGLHYPPVALGLLRYVGLETFALLTGLSLIAALAGLAATADNIWAWIAPLFFLGSPIYRTLWLRVGRPELLAWSIAALGWLLLNTMGGVPSGLLFGLAVLTHPTGGVFASFLALSLATLSTTSLQPLLVSWRVAALIGLPWLAAFFIVGRRKQGFRRLRETEPMLGLDRSLVATAATSGALSLVAWTLLGRPLDASWLPIAIFVALGFWLAWRRAYVVHATSFQLAMLFALTLAFVRAPTDVSAVLLLMAMYLPNGQLRRSEMGFEPGDWAVAIDTLGRLADKIPAGSRVALEFNETWASESNWAWLINTAWAHRDHLELLSGGSFDQVEYAIAADYERHVNLKEGAERLRTRMDHAGVTHFLAFTDRFADGLIDQGGSVLWDEWVDASPGYGKRRCRLIASPWPTSRATPLAPVETGPNTIRLQALAGQPYLLKYAWSAGWTARQSDGTELPIGDAEPGMTIEPQSDGWVTFTYRYRDNFREIFGRRPRMAGSPSGAPSLPVVDPSR